MFATLAGGYPRPDLGPDASADELVRAVLSDQEDAGLEILSDGHVRWADRVRAILERLEGFEVGGNAPIATREPRWDGPIVLDAWRFAAQQTELPVKATAVGPYTLANRCSPGAVGRERLTMVLADVLGHELRALFAAGCPIVQVDEDDAALIGPNAREQQLFKAAHRRLTHDLRRNHLTLGVTGGSVADLPPAILFDAMYGSYLFDFMTAPEAWRPAAAAPAERGIIAGVVDARTSAPDDEVHMVWAAMYAAAMSGRGADRVGLAPSGSLAGLSREEARAKIGALGRVARETHERLSTSGETLDLVALTAEGLKRGWLA